MLRAVRSAAIVPLGNTASVLQGTFWTAIEESVTSARLDGPQKRANNHFASVVMLESLRQTRDPQDVSSAREVSFNPTRDLWSANL